MVQHVIKTVQLLFAPSIFVVCQDVTLAAVMLSLYTTLICQRLVSTWECSHILIFFVTFSGCACETDSNDIT